MRHRKRTCKLNRTASHRRCMFANMLKSLVGHGKITTTLEKAKELRRHADKLVTLAKKGTLASRREAIARMMVRFNRLNANEQRQLREGANHLANNDRGVVDELFDVLGPRFANRQGGYTRVTRVGRRRGDNAQLAVIEFLED